MASGEAEPLQYTTTVLRVSIHCEGCKKKVKKVLQNIEGVYKVTIDAAQHKVTVTSSVGADALIRRLHKSGKHAMLWPSPAVAAAKKPDGVAAAPPTAAAPPAGERGKGAEKADKKHKEAAKKEAEPESSEKKPEKDKGSEEKTEAKKPKDEANKESEVSEKEKGYPGPPKEAAADEEGGEESGGKKSKKKKNKLKDAGNEDAAALEKPAKAPQPAPAPVLSSPERPHGGFPYYAPQPVMSYNVSHPSASVSSYYAPTPVMSMQPTAMPPPPPHMSYGYSPYPPMMMPPPPQEYLYGPPGMLSSPPQESYSNMFNEENSSSCRVM